VRTLRIWEQVDATVTLLGNAHTSMAAGHTLGALQPDGRRVVEPTFDPVHVADAVAHIASLPTSVTVLEMNIMSVCNRFS
jgi:hypothetical protein